MLQGMGANTLLKIPPPQTIGLDPAAFFRNNPRPEEARGGGSPVPETQPRLHLELQSEAGS
ncbi:MAG: hypothetical protein RLZZ436_3190 [Planctomycetota bacterium]|jgi:hypothetical protein